MQRKIRAVVLMASLILSVAARAETPQSPPESRPATEPVVATTANEQTLVRYYAAISEGRLDDSAAMLADDFRCAAPLPGMKSGRDSYRNFLVQFRTGFPDAKFEPVEFVSSGDTTVCRYRFTGTHRARFLTLRPTQKPADVTGIDVWKFRNGRMIELQGNFDALGLLVQLGVVPPLKDKDAANAKSAEPENPRK